MKACDLPLYSMSVELDPEMFDQINETYAFTFPLTLTEEELVANSEEPTEINDNTDDTKEYCYLEDVNEHLSGYRFEFTNGKLKDIYIDYLP